MTIDLPKMDNGWSKYEALVMETLEAHGKRLFEIDEKLTNIRIDIATMKGKAATWGAIAGLFVGGIAAIIADLFTRALVK